MPGAELCRFSGQGRAAVVTGASRGIARTLFEVKDESPASDGWIIFVPIMQTNKTLNVGESDHKMLKDVPPLSLRDFKLVPLLLLVNIVGFAVIFWSVYSIEGTEGASDFTIYFSLYFLLLWVVLSFVLRKGTTFLQFIFLSFFQL